MFVKRFSRALVVTAAASLVMAAAVFADNLQNDATSSGNNVINVGGSTTITYRLVGNNAPNGDVAGCNVDATHAATLTVSAPAGVTATPASVSFTDCGNAGEQEVLFSSNTAGSYSITHSISGGKSGALYQNQANFTLTVNGPVVVDTDGDGVADNEDNCPNDANADQADVDGDGLGDVCDDNSFAPAVSSAAADATGDEGDTLQTNGAFSDADGNATLTITKVSGDGDVTDNGDGTWDWSLATTDDASGTVVVQASDGEHAAAQDSFDWSATDVIPALSALSLTGNSGTACVGGNSVGLDFTFTSASVDTITGSIDWGDGSPNTAFSSSPVSESHTYAAGSYTITVNVQDEDGTSVDDSDNTATVSLLYSVSGVLQPVNDTQAKNDPSVFKYGSTIPVKIRVTDCNGASVSGLSPQIAVKKIAGSTPPTGTDEAISSTSGADSGTTMRYDAAGGLYIYNLATKSLGDSTATYEIKITGPFATVTAQFGTKAK